MQKNKVIIVQNLPISISKEDIDDYICITDIAAAKSDESRAAELAKTSNVRDYATINELTVLSNLETHNAQMIREGKSKEERFQILKEIADCQMKILLAVDNIVRIEENGNV